MVLPARRQPQESPIIRKRPRSPFEAPLEPAAQRESTGQLPAGLTNSRKRTAPVSGRTAANSHRSPTASQATTRPPAGPPASQPGASVQRKGASRLEASSRSRRPQSRTLARERARKTVHNPGGLQTAQRRRQQPVRSAGVATTVRTQGTLTATSHGDRRDAPRTVIGLPVWSEVAAGFGWKQSSRASWRAAARMLSFREPGCDRLDVAQSLLARGGDISPRRRRRQAARAANCRSGASCG
jgi:hypothetical protein